MFRRFGSFLAGFIIVFLVSCVPYPDPTRGNRFDGRIKNKTKFTLNLKFRAGFLTKRVRIEPGGSWSFWLDRRWILSEGVLEITE